MNYVLDTNILLVYLREAKTKAFIEDKYNPLGSGKVIIRPSDVEQWAR